MPCDCLFQGQTDRIAQVLQWWNEERQSAVEIQERSKGKRGGEKKSIFGVCFCFVLCIYRVDVYVINVFHQMLSVPSARAGS